MELFDHVFTTYGFPTALLVAMGWFFWVWGLNRNADPLKRGMLTKWIDQRIVNEQKSGKMVEVFTAYLDQEQYRREEDLKWKQRQVDQCTNHVQQVETLAVYQQQQNERSDEMIGELKGIRKSLHDSDGLLAPAKRIEISLQELSEVALQVMGKPWDSLTDEEQSKVQSAVERVARRHDRSTRNDP